MRVIAMSADRTAAPSRRAAARGFSALAAAIALALLAPGAALAAPSVESIEISLDGSDFDADFTGSLFAEAPTLVPHGGAETEFTVRNASGAGGVLSIELRGATWTDLDFARALRVHASAGAASGGSPRLSSATGCIALITGVPLLAGATLPIRIELQLGDLEHGAGQSASVGFDLGLTLSGDARADTACGGAPDLVVPAIAPTAGPGPDSSAAVDAAPGGEGEGRARPEGRVQPWFTVGLNTMADWFAQFVVIAGGSLVGVLLWIVIRRRRRPNEEASS